MSLLDLEKHFAFYGSYHSNPINIVIHVFLVWPILFTALLFLYFTPPIFSPSQTLLNYIPSVLIFNFGFFYAVFYALFYVALDVKAGSFVALLTLLCWAGSSFVANSIGFELAWKVVLGAQLFCWSGQIFGHLVFEILQTTIGYEPYPGFETKVKARTDANIKAWKAKQQKKLA
ncbi:2-hydroxy-palmitic acid dioxygenase mpo1 isoform X2 [Lathyrus oleraceus]|uniref:2-hydroxy-palmitic acid dioxygenase mpo1 isoform X2 n=1 Tax=Pisum sativum TaxID=3888 RepID=UPI0021D31817|nr:2-hydroxy-palmitic acid dioxygenase mpo1-like isoform X2 [Pisum sativum]